MDFQPAFSDEELPTDDEYREPNRSHNAGKNSALEQDSNIPVGWKATPEEPVPVVRCTGIVRNGPRKGEQCGRWSIRGHRVCLKHGGNLPGVQKAAEEVREAARLRLFGMADDAIDTIDFLIHEGTTPAAVKLKAATEILDRVGIKGGSELTHTVEVKANPAEEIAKRLATIAENLKPKEVEELVDEGEQDAEEVPEVQPDNHDG